MTSLLNVLEGVRGRVSVAMRVQDWLRAHLADLGPDAERYGLAQYADMRLVDYPLERSSLNVDEWLTRARRAPPKTTDALAAFIRDFMIEATTAFSNRTCPVCESLLRILAAVETGERIYACEVCTWQEFEGGSRAPLAARPATTAELGAR